MGAHPKAFERLAKSIIATTDPVVQDRLLDDWLEIRNLATNYDADLWGLNPDDPMWDTFIPTRMRAPS